MDDVHILQTNLHQLQKSGVVAEDDLEFKRSSMEMIKIIFNRATVNENMKFRERVQEEVEHDSLFQITRPAEERKENSSEVAVKKDGFEDPDEVRIVLNRDI
mmetsp:Transcript_24198/g.37254  ORF Transcript_24198/g.37254 Transcript_24198/m.37254 type:complete len:102 (-) Transcript_24198:1113-1418(-)